MSLVERENKSHFSIFVNKFFQIIFYITLLIGIIISFLFLFKIPVYLNFSEYYGVENFRNLKDYELLDSQDQKVSFKHLTTGKISFVYFGYTQCKQVCPTSMQILYQLSKITTSKNTQFIFISLDPIRDRGKKLEFYQSSYGKNFFAFTNTPEKLSEITKDFGVQAIKQQSRQSEDYEFDHTNFLYLIDPNGNLLLYYTSDNRELQKINKDIIKLEKRYGLGLSEK